MTAFAQVPATTTPSTNAEVATSSSSPRPTDSSGRFVKKDVPARISKFETEPVIDGQLNDAVWQSTPVFGDFLQTQPGDNIAPSNPTEVMIGYDSKNLYIAFRAKQERGKIRATVGRRDNVFGDDFVGMKRSIVSARSSKLLTSALTSRRESRSVLRVFVAALNWSIRLSIRSSRI